MPKARARHILVATEDVCQSLKEKIEGGADFAELAKEYSQSLLRSPCFRAV